MNATATLTPAQTELVTITFRPQAWTARRGGECIDVAASGETTCDVPLAAIAGFKPRTDASDNLRFLPQVPQWWRNWTGPFEIEWEERDVLQEILQRYENSGQSEARAIAACIREALEDAEGKPGSHAHLASAESMAAEFIDWATALRREIADLIKE